MCDSLVASNVVLPTYYLPFACLKYSTSRSRFTAAALLPGFIRGLPDFFDTSWNLLPTFLMVIVIPC
jgi:hypothetical protein